MSHRNGHGNRLPFPAPGRIPIVGESPAALPQGRFYYQVPCLIQWSGQTLQADSFELYFPMPLEGVRFKVIPDIVVAHLKDAHPDHDPAGLKVVPLQPFFLGFVPQEEIDKQEAAAKAAEVAIQ